MASIRVLDIVLLLLSLHALVMSSLAVRAMQQPGARNRTTYGLLALITIVVIALLSPAPPGMTYKSALLLALLFALPTYGLLVAPGTPLYVGVANGYVVLILLIWSFSSRTVLSVPTPWVLLALLFAGGAYYLLATRAQELWSAVAVATFLFLLAVWQALELYVQIGEWWSLFALLGMLFLLTGTFILAFDRLRTHVRYADLVVVSCIFAGLWLLAVSSWGQSLPLIS